MIDLDTEVAALISPIRRRVWVRLTNPAQLAGLTGDTPIRVKGQTTTLSAYGPFLRRMVRAGVRIQIAS